MELTVQLPDRIASLLGDRQNAERSLLEGFLADLYRSRRISRHDLSSLLALDYWQTEDFLTAHDAKRPYTLADLEQDRRSLASRT
jgi:hypothetical protein